MAKRRIGKKESTQDNVEDPEVAVSEEEIQAKVEIDRVIITILNASADIRSKSMQLLEQANIPPIGGILDATQIWSIDANLALALKVLDVFLKNWSVVKLDDAPEMSGLEKLESYSLIKHNAGDYLLVHNGEMYSGKNIAECVDAVVTLEEMK